MQYVLPAILLFVLVFGLLWSVMHLLGEPPLRRRTAERSRSIVDDLRGAGEG